MYKKYSTSVLRYEMGHCVIMGQKAAIVICNLPAETLWSQYGQLTAYLEFEAACTLNTPRASPKGI